MICRLAGFVEEANNKNIILRLLAGSFVVAQFASIVALASEEDYAIVSEVQITAVTTCTNSGVVKLFARQSKDRASLPSLRVAFQGRTFDVPGAELREMGAIDLSTIRLMFQNSADRKPLVARSLQTAAGMLVARAASAQNDLAAMVEPCRL